MTVGVSTIATGGFADARFSADGTRLYTVSGNTVSVLDVATGIRIAQYTVGTLLGAFDLSVDGHYLAVVEAHDGTSGTVYRIDLFSGAISTFSTSFGGSQGAFFDVAFTANGTALLTQRGYGSDALPVRQIDFATGQFTFPSWGFANNFAHATLTASAGHDRIQIDPASWSTAIYASGIGLVAQAYIGPSDPYAGATIATPTGPGVQATSPDGSLFALGHSVTILNSSMQVVASLGGAFPYLANPQGLAFSPDGRTLYVAVSDHVVAVSTATWQPVGTYALDASSILSHVGSYDTDRGFGDVLQASSDGHFLSVITTAGIQLIDLGQASYQATAGDDVINGGAALFGLSGNDDLTGNGSTRMFGGTGNDVYHVTGIGDQVIESPNEGDDTVRSTITFSLPANVEQLILDGNSAINGVGNSLDNRIIGNGAANILSGGEGNDQLQGGDGNDILDGGPGNDVLDGGAGIDTASYASASSAVTVSLAVVGPQNTGGAGIDVLSNIENLTGSFYNDVLTGDANANTLSGGYGDDTLVGGAGDDVLDGGDGNDLLLPGDGADTIIGGAGINTVSYADALAGVVVNLGVQILNGGAALGDTMLNVQNIVGSALDDDLTGDDNSNVIVGGAGNDQIHGAGGTDTVDYSRETGGGSIFVNLGSVAVEGPSGVVVGPSQVLDSFGNLDTLDSIEHIITGSGNDHLIGGDGDDYLEAGAGDDILEGGGGYNTLVGGSGNDLYINPMGGDTIVELRDGGRDAIQTFLPFFTLAPYANIENIYGSSPDGQWLVGNSLDNNVVGSTGNDRLDGKSGNDTITGGDGTDTLTGGPGNDTFKDTAAKLSGDTITDFGIGDKIVITDANIANFSCALSNNVLTFTGGSLTLANVPRNMVVIAAAAPGGGVQLTLESRFFDGGQLVLGAFGAAASAGGWASNDHYPRMLTDVNHDGFQDIVAFGEAGTYVTLGAANGGFGVTTFLAEYGAGAGAGGWTSFDHFPREMADVNGDGRADIVAFGQNSVYVALSNGDGTFGPSQVGTNLFTGSYGWVSNDQTPRALADINGDGRADLVGFGAAGVYVALAGADGTFAPATLFAQFGSSGAAGSWASNDQYLRLLADVNGDGRADIVAFGQNAVYTALGNGDGTFASQVATTEFTSALGWTSNNIYPRELADVNGDGRLDIVGFGSDGVYVALGNGNGSFQGAVLDIAQFGSGPGAGGWASQDIFPRYLADMDHNGSADIVGFGSAGIYVAYSYGVLG